MEEAPLSFPLRHCDHLQKEEAASHKPSIFGNEENAPENLIETETLTKLQQRVIKKMRMGGTPYKHRGSRRFSSGGNVPSFGTHQQENQPLLFDSTSAKFAVTSSSSINDTALPHKDGSQRECFDEIGQQNKGNTDVANRHSISVMKATDKDPRFHSKRTLDRAQKALEREERLTHAFTSAPNRNALTEKQTVRETMMDEQQVFLAPVMGPPSMSSPWKSASENSTASHHCISDKDPGLTGDTNAAVAAAQEAPGLAVSSSQESSSSSAAPSTNTSSSASTMASDLVKRLVNTKRTTSAPVTVKPRLPSRPGVKGTPVRLKPKKRSEDVQATDHGYASVSKLSAWLADDPTSTKKVRQVRRGANVISKSRQFEKDLEYEIAEENNISSGAVKERKNWLKTVFSNDTEDGESQPGRFQHRDPNRHLVAMRTKPITMDDSCARSEFVVGNDAASTISVNDKKQWLQNAFRREGQSFASRAKSDIGPLRESREDVTSRAKQMWYQKSEKRLPNNAPYSAQKPPKASAASPLNKHAPANQHSAIHYTTPRKLMEDCPKVRSSIGDPVSASTQKPLGKVSGASSDAGKFQLEEDTAPVDFRAARELLIRRSKQNGNELKVASKVQRRTDKFEKISEEKRRSSAVGLLKPTWSSDSGSDAPSTAYTKTFVANIAPKRSFDDLP